MRKILVSLALAGSLCAGEFWNDKEPAAWSEKEIERMLTKSPWAKQVTAAMDFSKMRGMGGGPPGGMGGPGMGGGPPGGGMGGPGMGGGPPGGGMGGPGMGGGPPGMGGGPPGGMPEFKATVRWESAAPIRAALKKGAPEEDADLHIVGITGLPMMGRGGNQEMAARRKQMLEELKTTTSLTGKGKTSVNPTRVHVDESTGAVYFFFAKSDALTPDAKELTFTTQMGPMEFKAKFAPKEMKYKGQAAL
jgi:hypothetical protein